MQIPTPGSLLHCKIRRWGFLVCLDTFEQGMSWAVEGRPAHMHTTVLGGVPRPLPHAGADVLQRHVLQRPVWQALAQQDLAHMSQGGPSERWRRSAIFDDESGQCWSTVVQHCLGEVPPSSHSCRYLLTPWLSQGQIILSVCKHGWLHVVQVEEMVSRTAAGLPQSSKPAEKKPAAAPIWNMHAASFKVIALACLTLSQTPYATRPTRCCHASLL